MEKSSPYFFLNLFELVVKLTAAFSKLDALVSRSDSLPSLSITLETLFLAKGIPKWHILVYILP